MKLSGELKTFETRLGHTFANPGLLVRAVTHSSMSSPNRDDNQRLEFLGDRVLGLVMAEAMLEIAQIAGELHSMRWKNRSGRHVHTKKSERPAAENITRSARPIRFSAGTKPTPRASGLTRLSVELSRLSPMKK